MYRYAGFGVSWWRDADADRMAIFRGASIPSNARPLLRVVDDKDGIAFLRFALESDLTSVGTVLTHGSVSPASRPSRLADDISKPFEVSAVRA